MLLLLLPGLCAVHLCLRSQEARSSASSAHQAEALLMAHQHLLEEVGLLLVQGCEAPPHICHSGEAPLDEQQCQGAGGAL
jgi:hypothetical protein